MTRHPKKEKEKPVSNNPDTKDTSPEVPTPSQTEGVKRKNPLDKLFWLRVGMGILAGALSAELGFSIEETSRPFLGFGIMIILFIISYAIAKAMRIQLPTSDKKKLIMTGIGSYFFMFVFSWILVNTLIHPEVGLQVIR
ncbi:MAG: hypothetical protein HY222_07825 [Thaumarchaeota archaeon]|nr:hypothetical protein [Nitrososphaerota archaeon]MBI3642283.1 hypothetical protein [Nitrososphaerota archaeon]